jgi:hypothetical protein
MASAVVQAALVARLQTNWTTVAAPAPPPIYAMNSIGSVPADGSAFMAWEFPLASEAQASIGSPGANVWREQFVFRVVLCVPIGQGVDPASTPWSTWLDALRATFRGAQFVSGQRQINCHGASMSAQTSQSDFGAYFEMSFVVDGYSDLIG